MDRNENLQSYYEKLELIEQENRNIYQAVRYNYIKYYKKLPIDKKLIFCESNSSEDFSGNVFYILKYIAKAPEYADYKICLSCHLRRKKVFEDMLERYGLKKVELVILSSDRYFRVLATAKYLINDTGFAFWWIKKKGQVYLKTGYGTKILKAGRGMNRGYYPMSNIQKNLIAADYLLFPNKHEMASVLRDFMVENIGSAKCLIGGEPKNEILFQPHNDAIRKEFGLCDKKFYAYMPNIPGNGREAAGDKARAYIYHYLTELDEKLSDDEVLFVKLDLGAKKNSPLSDFKHIQPFPADIEDYEFIREADVFISDWSPAVIDFSVTDVKTVLFIYDEQETRQNTGLYYELRGSGLLITTTSDELIKALRSDKIPHTKAFSDLSEYKGTDFSKPLADCLLKGKTAGFTVFDYPVNGKENVLIYAGNLARNGITRAAINLFNTLDTNAKNYFLLYNQDSVKGREAIFKLLPEGVGYYGISGRMQTTLKERKLRESFIRNLEPVKPYIRKMKKRYATELKRILVNAPFDTLIQFNGYENEMIVLFSAFRGRKVIYVHNNMLEEMKMKANQNFDVLEYAYRHYDSVCVVTKDLIPSTTEISGGRHKAIRVCRNIINYDDIIADGNKEVELDPFTAVYPSSGDLYRIIGSDTYKFISIGRFSPEKGHLRLVEAFKKVHDNMHDTSLVIIGGVSNFDYYEKTIEKIEELGLTSSVVLVKNVSNPYAILSRCDGFVLSSYYEGFGLVIAEADILKKPVISTRVDGPTLFMEEHGGCLVDNSDAGLYEGMMLLANKKVPVMNVDYYEYNRQARDEFERLFTG